MFLKHGRHLAYCTNVHRGQTWTETFASLQEHTLAVRERVCPESPYAIGLRLSEEASRELMEASIRRSFRKWLDQNGCYIFTINGFPYGRFHGTQVREQVYLPDWASVQRLDYTKRLFDLLAELVPAGIEGSVSTLPGAFKELVRDVGQEKAIRDNLFHCVEHIARVSGQSGRKLHLGLEPEPLCLLETSAEVVTFFDQLRAEHPGDDRIDQYLGVNYDTCHQAVEFEKPAEAIHRLQQHGIKISKFHLSSALRLKPTAQARSAMAGFASNTYLHQVVVREAQGQLIRYKDLGDALNRRCPADAEEWRVHFHVPLHSDSLPSGLSNTNEDLCVVLDLLQADPSLGSHLEMETYTWEVLPPALKSRTVVEQLASEYNWCLAELTKRGLA